MGVSCIGISSLSFTQFRTLTNTTTELQTDKERIEKLREKGTLNVEAVHVYMSNHSGIGCFRSCHWHFSSSFFSLQINFFPERKTNSGNILHSIYIFFTFFFFQLLTLNAVVYQVSLKETANMQN